MFTNDTLAYNPSRLSVVPLIILMLAVLLLTSPTRPSYSEERDNRVTEIGDYLQFILPGTAALSTFIAGGPDGKIWDREGTWQFTKSLASSVVTVASWKSVAGKLRPHEGNRLSFPSGHTNAAFVGASFFGTRYGWQFGIPAYALAIFTGYSRVQADAHFPDDVLAGASIAMLYNWLYVTPHPKRVSIVPVLYEDGGGIKVTVKGGEMDPQVGREEFRPRFRFNFGFGPAYLLTNEITSPTNTGTTFDLSDFRSDPLTTAAVDFEIFLDDRNEIVLYYSPIDFRDRGSFGSPVLFGGKQFPASTEIKSSWRFHDLRARWGYNFPHQGDWSFHAGVGLLGAFLQVDLETDSGPAVSAEVEDNVVLPYLAGRAGYQLGRKWTATLDVNGTLLPEDWLLESALYFLYKISDQWEAGIGWYYYGREIETSEITNKIDYTAPYLAFSYAW